MQGSVPVGELRRVWLYRSSDGRAPVILLLGCMPYFGTTWGDLAAFLVNQYVKYVFARSLPSLFPWYNKHVLYTPYLFDVRYAARPPRDRLSAAHLILPSIVLVGTDSRTGARVSKLVETRPFITLRSPGSALGLAHVRQSSSRVSVAAALVSRLSVCLVGSHVPAVTVVAARGVCMAGA